MPNIRLYTDSPLRENDIIELSKEQAHYLCNVMRQKEGAELLLFNTKDGEWSGAISSITKKNCSIQLRKKTREQKAEPDIWLCFAPVKNAPVNNLIQKATELGASKLVPVITERTIVSRVNTERLHLIAIEAAEQSCRLSVPDITEPVKLANLLKSWDEERKLILCDESGGGLPFVKALSGHKKGKYAIIIGPEGGFSKSEFELLKNKPYVIAVGMGPRILRADTAALAALTSYMNILGDWDDQPDFK